MAETRTAAKSCGVILPKSSRGRFAEFGQSVTVLLRLFSRSTGGVENTMAITRAKPEYRPSEYIDEEGLYERFLIPPRTAQRLRAPGADRLSCGSANAASRIGWPMSSDGLRTGPIRVSPMRPLVKPRHDDRCRRTKAD